MEFYLLTDLKQADIKLIILVMNLPVILFELSGKFFFFFFGLANSHYSPTGLLGLSTVTEDSNHAP